MICFSFCFFVFLLFFFSCKTKEVFDWWSKYDASRVEEAKAAEEKVMRPTVIIN